MSAIGGSCARRKKEGTIPHSGHEFEKVLFGFSSDPYSIPEYLDFHASLLECLENQPAGWDPYRPPTKLGQKLRYWVAKHFTRRGQRFLGLYVAVGHSSDWWHQVDCLFYYDPADGPRRLEQAKWVTIDVSSYDKQRLGKEMKANFLITRENFIHHDLKKIGWHIATYLKGQIDLPQLRVVSRRWSE